MVCSAWVRITLLAVARRSPERLLPGRPTCTPGQGHVSPLDYRAGQPRPRLGHTTRILPPQAPAGSAGETPHTYQQLHGPPPQRQVGQVPGHRPTSLPLGAASLVEGVLEPNLHAALHDRALRREELAQRG